MILFHTKDDGLTISVGGINFFVLMEDLRTKANYPKDKIFGFGRRCTFEENRRLADGTDQKEYQQAIECLNSYSPTSPHPLSPLI